MPALTKTIEVIPGRFLLDPKTGQTASFYGAHPPGFEVHVEGFTWRVVDHEGRVTVGLCRARTKDLAEANEVAQRFAERRGYRVVGGAA